MAVVTTFCGIPLSFKTDSMDRVPYAVLLPFQGAFGGMPNDCMFAGNVTLGANTHVILPASNLEEFLSQNRDYQGSVIAYEPDQCLRDVVRERLTGIGAYVVDYENMRPGGFYEHMHVVGHSELNLQDFFNAHTAYQGHHNYSGFGRIESLFMPIVRFFLNVGKGKFETKSLITQKELSQIIRLVQFEFRELDRHLDGHTAYVERKRALLEWLCFYADLLKHEITAENYEACLAQKRVLDGIPVRPEEVGSQVYSPQRFPEHLRPYTYINIELMNRPFAGDDILVSLLLERLFSRDDDKESVVSTLNAQAATKKHTEQIFRFFNSNQERAIQMVELPIEWHKFLDIAPKAHYDVWDFLPALEVTSPLFGKGDHYVREWPKTICLRQTLESFEDTKRRSSHFVLTFMPWFDYSPINLEIRDSFGILGSSKELREKWRHFLEEHLKLERVPFDFDFIEEIVFSLQQAFIQSERETMNAGVEENPMAFMRLFSRIETLKKEGVNYILGNLFKQGRFGKLEEMFDFYGLLDEFNAAYPEDVLCNQETRGAS